MQIYLLIACDRLEESQEKNLIKNLPELQAALQSYVDEGSAFDATMINDCESEYPEDWQLGLTQTVKKGNQLKFPINLFTELANKFKIDCEIGEMKKDKRDPVSYFGHSEGKGDAFRIAQYLDL